MSEYEDEPKKKTILELHGIINRRYLGMVKNGPSGDVYITSFFLKLSALNQPDLLHRTFVLRGKTRNNDEDLISGVLIRKETFLQIGKFICKVRLWHQYSQPPSASPDALHGLDPKFASADLIQQLVAYAKHDYPFNLPIADSECPLAWWKKLWYHSQASLLVHCAIKLLSICANSMADEQTMSKVTKLNTHLCNWQDVQTLLDMIQIASYTTSDSEAPPPPKRPVIKWRDINQDLGVRPPGPPASSQTNPPFKLAKTSWQANSDSDTETSGMSDPQGDAWLDRLRTAALEHMEKSKLSATSCLAPGQLLTLPFELHEHVFLFLPSGSIPNLIKSNRQLRPIYEQLLYRCINLYQQPLRTTSLLRTFTLRPDLALLVQSLDIDLRPYGTSPSSGGRKISPFHAAGLAMARNVKSLGISGICLLWGGEMSAIYDIFAKLSLTSLRITRWWPS
ncbi:hypothetical protein FRC01_006615, partial [Tulasnella sp. 417]